MMFRKMSAAAVCALGLALAAGQARADHETTQFKGPKANTGRVVHSESGGKLVLTLSKDFQIPNTPAPHWQVVDSKGNVYLLQQLKIKGGTNRSITLPAYVPDVAKVQIWCSWAESLLGEAEFDTPARSAAGR
jgi:hypothetical protein